MSKQFPNFVYIVVYGFIWKLNFKQFLTVLKNGAEGNGYDLHPYKKLKYRPKWFYETETTDGRQQFASIGGKIFMYNILDWTESDYATSLEELKENKMPSGSI